MNIAAAIIRTIAIANYLPTGVILYGIAEALFKLATANKEEWEGIFLGHLLLLEESGTPWSSVLQWGLNQWKRRPWEPLDLIS